VELKPGADDPEIANFHYWDPEHQHDANPLFDRIRATCPVAWSDRYGGFWLLTQYEDVFRAYQEPTVFSSYPNSIPAEGLGNERRVIPLETDPPEHTAYREILAPLFTAHRTRPLEAKIRGHAVELVSGIRDRGECEYVSEFAKVLPTRVFLDMMGWPMSDAPMFLDWCEKLMRDIPGADADETKRQKEETGKALYGYFAAELQKRSAAGPPVPGDKADFIDWLRGAQFAGERPLTPFEILDCIFIVLLAGLDTTQGVLGLSMEYLADHPDYRQDLLDHPEILDSAVEELLRWFAPVLPGRRVTKDVEMGGVTLREGDRVMLGMGSACRDEDVFSDAAIVDFRRSPNRHIAFGAGAHRCLGSHLARLELRISLAEWLARIPEFAIRPGATVRRHLCAVRGVDELPLLF
jgi:cytochrome P450